MNRAQIESLVRAVVKVGAGYLLAKGMADQGTVEILSAGAMAFAGTAWGVKTRKKAPKATATVGAE